VRRTTTPSRFLALALALGAVFGAGCESLGRPVTRTLDALGLETRAEEKREKKKRKKAEHELRVLTDPVYREDLRREEQREQADETWRKDAKEKAAAALEGSATTAAPVGSYRTVEDRSLPGKDAR